MKIAFIEFEFPPDTAKGGIAAYTWETARALTKRGHVVEVFAGAKGRTGSFLDDGIMVHRVSDDPTSFFLKAGHAFFARNEVARFDVLEGSELTAPAREAVRLVPYMPLVVRLHGPSFKLRSMSMPAMKMADRFRIFTGALRRGERPFWWKNANDRIEAAHAHRADVIAVTSKTVGDLICRHWRVNPQKMISSPLPFSPSPALLDIQPVSSGHAVTFVGHLCVGKGLVELVDAMRRVMERNHSITLNLVGQVGAAPDHTTGDMRDFILKHLSRFGERISIPGPISRKEIPEIFRRTDILVLPSHWDTFPVACLEAMAAGRAIIGSTSGGMAEMLDNGRAGILVPPFRSKVLADAILRLAEDAVLRESFGIEARRRVCTFYSIERTLDIQERCYKNAIEERSMHGER
jgi:glycogen synthase